VILLEMIQREKKEKLRALSRDGKDVVRYNIENQKEMNLERRINQIRSKVAILIIFIMIV